MAGLTEGIDFYYQNGYKVLTKTYLLKVREVCCTNLCRHCPWDYRYKMILEKDTLFIDMDGVLADFEKKAIELLGENIAPEGSEERSEQISNCQHIPHFYKYLEPMPGAIEAYKELDKHYDVYILSAPSWPNEDSYTDKRIWVHEHLGDIANKKLILSHNKGLFTGRALIDDRIKYGVDKFKGEHIHFGTSKFPNWDSVIDYLIQKEVSSPSPLS